MYLAPLELTSSEALLDSIATATSPELVAVARRLTRIFSIMSPFAPGLHCVGGEILIDGDPTVPSDGTLLSVAGNGETLAAALVSCLGESAEFVSQFERPGDIQAGLAGRERPHSVADGWIAEAISRSERPLDWVDASDASSGDAALLPADLCLRRPPTRRAFEPVGALSSGVSAGPTFETAALRAILELCERDAAAMWWLGGCRPKRFALEHPATSAGVDLIARLRQGETTRQTMLLDITTDSEVPAIAAVSVDHDGRGLACGLSSRLTATDAARAAILEMCQMEMAAPLAQTKCSEGGDTVLNAADRRHLRRAEFAATNCRLLHPQTMALHADLGAPLGLGGLTAHLRKKGIRLFLHDHTRQDVGVHVVRAVSPDLQPFSPTVSTRRFAEARRENQSHDISERDITPI